MNIGSHIQVLSNNFKLVYTNEDPSICLMYDIQTRQHSVYYVRRVTSQEKIDFVQKINSTFHSAASLSNKVK